MELTPQVQDQLDAVRAGLAFAPLDARVFEIEGPDARKWLNDLVTAGIDPLGPGDPCESLLLDATGRIKAHFIVGCTSEESFLLVQSSDQPESVGKMLARYILSSKVTLTDVSDARSVFRFTGSAGGPWTSWMLADAISPVVVYAATADEAAKPLSEVVTEAIDGFEAARILDGTPRFPVDFVETSLPAEAKWDDRMVDSQKGCFLGQESVAKIRNRGRPPFVVVGLRTEARVEPSDPILVDGAETGVVASALTGAAGSHVIARIRWFADDLPDLRTRDGVPLVLSDPPVNVVR